MSTFFASFTPHGVFGFERPLANPWRTTAGGREISSCSSYSSDLPARQFHSSIQLSRNLLPFSAGFRGKSRHRSSAQIRNRHQPDVVVFPEGVGRFLAPTGRGKMA
jgi:hypothetical protein